MTWFCRQKKWHKSEWKKIKSELTFGTDTNGKGIRIDEEIADKIYEHSKIKDETRKVSEPRYTPRLNIILLSAYGRALAAGKSPEIAWNDTQELLRRVTETKEAGLDQYPIDQKTQSVMMSNLPADFAYKDYAQEMFTANGSNCFRVIASRGTIEGPLGQIYKVHASGIMDNDVDMAIYTNDLKYESINLLYQMIPGADRKPCLVLEDNPAELHEWYEKGKRGNFELALVRHLGVKRRDTETNLPLEGRAIDRQFGLLSKDFVGRPIKEITSSTGKTVIDIYHPAS